MNKKIIPLMVLTSFFLILTAGRAYAPTIQQIDYVDIGDPTSEIGHSLVGWGPIEPATHGGSWGSIAPGNCRVTWYPGGDTSEACVTLKPPTFLMSAKTLKTRVLDGIADDSFEVYINYYSTQTGWRGWRGWMKVYSYVSDPSTNEYWVTHTINLPLEAQSTSVSKIMVMITSTAQQWAYFGTYGQLAVDWIELDGFLW